MFFMPKHLYAFGYLYRVTSRKKWSRRSLLSGVIWFVSVQFVSSEVCCFLTIVERTFDFDPPMLHSENRWPTTVFEQKRAELRELRQASETNGRKSCSAEAIFLPFSYFVLLLKW